MTSLSAAMNSMIVCPTCRTTITAPPGAPVIQCGICRNLVSVGAPPHVSHHTLMMLAIGYLANSLYSSQTSAYPAPYGAAPPPYPSPAASPYPSSVPSYLGAPSPAPYPAPPPIGRRKALIIGICYKGSPNQLGGCINDAKCMKYLLTTK